MPAILQSEDTEARPSDAKRWKTPSSLSLERNRVSNLYFLCVVLTG